MTDRRRTIEFRRICAASCLVASIGAALLASSALEAQDTAVELLAAVQSGDPQRCDPAVNVAYDLRAHAEELAKALFEVVAEAGPCQRAAISVLINLGFEITEGVAAERAVPPLMDVIERGLGVSYGPPVSMAESSMRLLSYFGAEGADALPLLMQWLALRPELRAKKIAIDAIGSLGEAATPVAPELIEFLADSQEESGEARELQLAVLGELAGLPAVTALAAPPLIELLGTDDREVSKAAERALVAGGLGVVAPLFAELEAESEDRRERAWRILARLESDGSRAATGPFLPDLLDDPSALIRDEAAALLRDLEPSEELIGRLVDLVVRHEEVTVRTEAAGILGSYGADAVSGLAALRTAAASGEWELSRAAEASIDLIENPDPVQVRRKAQAASLASCDVSGCPGWEVPSVQGAESPEDVLEALQAVARTGNAHALVGLLPPSARCDYLFNAVDFISRMIGVTEDYWPVAKRHGYLEPIRVANGMSPRDQSSKEEIFERFRAQVRERGCEDFLADTLQVVASHMHFDDYPSYLLGSIPVGSEMKLEATDEEEVVLGHIEGMTLRFVRENGRWFGVPPGLF